MAPASQLLSQERFDVLIVGAGIYGATLARETALRGLRTALIESGDFGAATSANSLKIMHGGLRHLQRFDWRGLRESVRARRRLLALAPHLVRPLAMVVPTQGIALRGRPIMAAALAVNDIMSRDRNRDVHAARRLPRAYTVERRAASILLPGLPEASYDGAAIWFDAIAEDTERLCLGFVQSAIAHGATACNYVKGERLLRAHDQVIGVAARDTLTGADFEVHASVIVDATGPWCGRIEEWPLPVDATPRYWTRALNLYVPRPLFEGHAVGLAGRPGHHDSDALVHKGGRFFFFVPWRGGTLIGTEYRVADRDANCIVTANDLAEFLNEINGILPSAQLRAADIALHHCGLMPIRAQSTARDPSAELLRRTCVADSMPLAGVGGLIAVVGTKYTTAVESARSVADLVQTRMGKLPSLPASDPPLPGAEDWSEHPPASWRDSISDDGVRQRLWSRYGRSGSKVYESAGRDQTLPASAVLECEVIHAVRREMARTLGDVVWRRTDLGARGEPAPDALERCADLLALEMRWDASQRAAQLDAVRRESARRTVFARL